MITLIEALNYRSLRYISQPLGSFHVLVGPNASGKTNFLDVPAFLSRLVSDGLEAAIEERTPNFQDLLWGRKGQGFELAIEVKIPESQYHTLPEPEYNTIRYEVAIGFSESVNQVVIQDEQVILKRETSYFSKNGASHEEELKIPKTILTRKEAVNQLFILEKDVKGSDNFYSEAPKRLKGATLSAPKLETRTSAFANLPEDQTKYPVIRWFKNFLQNEVIAINLDIKALRKPSPPGQGFNIKPDGSNLPWLIEELKNKNPDLFEYWLGNLQLDLSDLKNICTVQREDSGERYLVVQYQNGLEVPSWGISEGTLRLFALTILHHLIDFEGTYLIEQPENNIYPLSIETVYQSLINVHDAQVLMTTQAPRVVTEAELKPILAFNRSSKRGTTIVAGKNHHILKNWQHEISLGTLFAGGAFED